MGGVCSSDTASKDEPFPVQDVVDDDDGVAGKQVVADPFPKSDGSMKVTVDKARGRRGSDSDSEPSMSSERRKQVMDKFQEFTPQPSPDIGPEHESYGLAMQNEEDTKAQDEEDEKEIPKLEGPPQAKKKKRKKRVKKPWVVSSLVIVNIRVSRDPITVTFAEPLASDDTILKLKQALFDDPIIDTPVEGDLDRIILVHKGRRTLKNAKPIREYGIKDGHNLFCVISSKKKTPAAAGGDASGSESATLSPPVK